MTENEYTMLSNRVRITSALEILRGILTGEDVGITQKDLSSATKILSTAESKLYAKINIKG